MDASLRPQFFISRQDGSLTPLVAVDELPPLMSIRGVPRLLSQNETQGMTSLGSANHRGQFYVVDCFAHDTAEAVTTVGDQKSLAVGSKNSNSRQKGNPKKEYCSFWLRHGECDYQQQGCIFKHEMPLDPAVLEKLGLRDIPRWYREKHIVKSIAANVENSRIRANRSNVQALFHGGKKDHPYEHIAIGTSGVPLQGHNQAPQNGPGTAHDQACRMNLLQSPSKTHLKPIAPTGRTVGSGEQATATLDGIFGPPKRFDLVNQNNLKDLQKPNTANTAVKSKDNFGQIVNGLNSNQPYSLPVTAAGFSRSNIAQPINANLFNGCRALNGNIGNDLAPHQNGTTPTLKPGTQSPWSLYDGKADFSGLSMSFVPPKPVSDLSVGQEHFTKKQQKSRRLYQPLNDLNTLNSQDTLTTINRSPSNDIEPKSFYPFEAACPQALDHVYATSNGANAGSYSSPVSSERNSSTHSTTSSFENGCTKVCPDNFYFERTASMTSRIFDINGECDLFDLSLNDDVRTQRPAF
ncbi:predicted protein [Uncinocarpus reesii 1704]|uniref:C3H1-type domain-containing protein n=1 Tax=Uncinocarpus reesii (strain UAMH 1704) TaxID=336963 RepID=C4JDU6_UNCRE|nr:uncharacterized protein UREG_00573 [Uncinocarpus reesii 1704]EEP75726.1 predicted protein [Uncinocarpus reesii 1704]